MFNFWGKHTHSTYTECVVVGAWCVVCGVWCMVRWCVVHVSVWEGAVSHSCI